MKAINILRKEFIIVKFVCKDTKLFIIHNSFLEKSGKAERIIHNYFVSLQPNLQKRSLRDIDREAYRLGRH